MEKEILNIKLEVYRIKQAEICKLKLQLNSISEDIIKTFCPFKSGDKVLYREYWRGNDKEYSGIVRYIKFEDQDEDAIDQKWVVCIEPMTKDFKKPRGGYNSSYVYIGKNKNDFIKLAN